MAKEKNESNDSKNESKTLHLAWEEFQETLDALLELNKFMTPHAAKLDQRRRNAETIANEIGLTGEQRSDFIDLLNSIRGGSSGALQDQREDEVESHIISEYANKLLEVFGSNKSALAKLVLKIRKHTMSTERAAILRNSLLTMAIGALEVLIGRMATSFYAANIGILAKNKEFSIKDLEEYGSIESAKESVIASHVDSLLRGSLADWIKWYDESFKLDSKTYCIDHDVLTEAFQMRHIIVHNAGAVSRQYLQKVTEKYRNADVGERLGVDEEYLTRAIDEIESIGNLMIAGAWCKLAPGQTIGIMANLHARTYHLMQVERWLPVRRICSVAKKVKSNELMRNISQCNEWLAIKRTTGIDRIRGEIASWDVSAFDPAFGIVKHALLDDLDAAFETLPDIKSPMITEETLESWPVLAELRADPRYRAHMANAYHRHQSPADAPDAIEFPDEGAGI